MNKLNDKIALVTGARRGMGKSHALALAKEGAKVVVSDISLEECQIVVDEIKGAGGDALAVNVTPLMTMVSSAVATEPIMSSADHPTELET